MTELPHEAEQDKRPFPSGILRNPERWDGRPGIIMTQPGLIPPDFVLVHSGGVGHLAHIMFASIAEDLEETAIEVGDLITKASEGHIVVDMRFREDVRKRGAISVIEMHGQRGPLQPRVDNLVQDAGAPQTEAGGRSGPDNGGLRR